MKKSHLNYIMHIPKTAGMSLQYLARRQHKAIGALELIYTLEKQQKGFENRPELQTVMGHFRYGIHRFSNRPAYYFTYLRNPIDHVISHYQYTKDFPEKFEFLPKESQSIIDFAKGPYGNNLQSRFISGITKHDTDLQVILETAKANLNQFEVVGITEEFDLSLLMMAKALNWKTLYYTRMNDGKTKKKEPYPSPEVIQELEEILKYDIELYKLGLQIFEKQRQANLDLVKKLPQFQRMNSYFQQLNPTYIKFKKVFGLVK
ncbi:Sulfotransferase family [Owenweeksia hongkongensis DSM 17368]|uniref:Sulfotransferase family n=1 Tax=Owenweeksia hongkongensis (strain DSM 17368 / CIP 108786 / JCM 12287 / NRRL B-23963 / UST20020801) TaxID=926562 RepID=G8R3W6_OWEHD|nr:sulfotransferase family 2 domain-containing protein [Owenweeksia hongkongensis]AEV31998.1 Sulfotransferase family [Owenweeksia hongkongensis DSM 17368]